MIRKTPKDFCSLKRSPGSPGWNSRPGTSSKASCRGLHRSPYFGQSVEFAQHREYVPGDDIRRVDWKVWSKTDKYYLKQYEEETNLRTTLVVDVSESMQFGGGLNKYEYACRIAAVSGVPAVEAERRRRADDIR